MKARKPMGFLVRLIPPAGTNPGDLRAYVEDAVATWCGSYSPENPIFHLDGDTVRVSVRSLTVNRIERAEDLAKKIEWLEKRVAELQAENLRLIVEQNQMYEAVAS